MATTAIAALARSFPGARVDVATGPWSRPGLARNPHVGCLLDSEALIGGRTPTPRMLLRAAARLRRGAYDGAVVLERGFWLALLPLLAGIPVRAGFDSGGRGLTHTLPVGVAGVRHEAERYLACARAVGATVLVRRMVFEPGDEARAAAALALASVRPARRPYAVLHPGGGTNPGMRLDEKRWPAERFAAIADRLAADGVTPVVVWGPGEAEVGQRLVRAARRAPAVVGDALSLAGVGALAAAARVYVANDSGPTHVALAVGAPTVAVFGPSDERRYGPFGDWPDGTPIGEAVANPRLDPADPRGPWLARSVEAVGVDDVWAAVERVVARAEKWRGR